ncbi:YoaK family protein [Novosphingobium olei]|uniref:DUF1275 domain-containing protein n=1 Tax=Novosphingobium olei TaxID=2728851 RepID=A0A7Y0BSA3_9SPHN|nr:YoaK family protein [Novosphingobium olei]NML95642.1 DUF1275 domain-containing protein [Novosphingobium olei]BEV00464.1 DUF1275 domain-containing protein [Novosphingobium olei]
MATSPPAPVRTPAPLFRLLLLLSASTGMLDAASILCLGKVFTANMTGNVVFLAFAAAGAPGFTVTPYLIALAAFIVGAIVAGRVWRMPGPRSLQHWLVVAALIEAALLIVAGLTALGAARPEDLPPWRLFAILALTASAMGFRNAIVRQLKVPDLTTTVLTLTITGLASDSQFAAGSGANRNARLAAVAMIFGGAVIGAALVLHAGLAATLLLTALIVLVGTVIFTRHPLMADLRR